MTGNECYDVLVLDEIELMIHHLFSKAVLEKDRERILLILRGLVKNAMYVIASQAGLTDLTIFGESFFGSCLKKLSPKMDFLKSCGRDDIHVVRNDYQRA